MATIEELFGIPGAKGDLPVKPAGDHTPAPSSNYAFKEDILRVLLLWTFGPQVLNLYLTGPTGCGKSSVIEQFAARLGLGVIRVGCHSRMEMSDLVGRFVLNQTGGMDFTDGPLVQAMRLGCIFLLDEADLLPPPVAMGLNAVLDGSPLFILETKERLFGQPGFRIAVTGNSAGAGDSTGLYRGVVRQNLAWMDRFVVLSVDYLSEAEEVVILRKAVPNLPEQLAAKMVQVAGAVRQQYLGSSAGDASLDITLSTRTLVRWAQLSDAWRLAKQTNPLKLALQHALLNRASPSTAIAINGIAARMLGDLYEREA